MSVNNFEDPSFGADEVVPFMAVLMIMFGIKEPVAFGHPLE